jgi:hypothetical protein
VQAATSQSLAHLAAEKSKAKKDEVESVRKELLESKNKDIAELQKRHNAEVHALKETVSALETKLKALATLSEKQ